MAIRSVIVAMGASSKKFIDGSPEQRDVIPLVISEGNQFGVGLQVLQTDGTEGRWSWGMIAPRLLIRSWRAMKMLEEMPRIEINGSMCHAWTLASERIHRDDHRYLAKEAALYGDYEKYREMRAKALAMFPSNDELAAMLAIIEENGIGISPREVEEDRRKYPMPVEAILRRLQEADDKELERQRQREEAQKQARLEAQRVAIAASAIIPKRPSVLQRLFG